MKITGIATGAIAFSICVALIPTVKAMSERFGLFDSPGPLKIHSRLIPRLGGVAIAISLASTVLIAARLHLATAFPFFAALTLIWLAGLVDDISGLSPVVRLAAQIGGALMLWHGGWRVPILGNGAIGIVGICVFVVAFVNAFNFWDGSDGVVAGTTLIISAAYIALNASAQPGFGVTPAWALAGSCLGFLLFNFPPANFFMGDSGSTILGFTVAYLALNPARPNVQPSVAVCVATLPAALPLLDAAFVILRRLRNRKSPFYGDRTHFYDKMLALGLSARTVTLVCYGITGIFCSVGYFADRLAVKNENAQAIALSAMSVVGFVILEWRLGSLRVSETGWPLQQTTALRVPNALRDSR